MARRELRPREADHLRGRRGTSPVRQTTIPQHQNPINKQTNNFLFSVIFQCFFNLCIISSFSCSFSISRQQKFHKEALLNPFFLS